MANIKKDGKKDLTKEGMSGILTKLSARGSPRGRPEGKKALTVRQKCGNLRNYYRYRVDRRSQEFLKKVLDKRDEVLYNSNVPPGAACTL